MIWSEDELLAARATVFDSLYASSGMRLTKAGG